MGNEVNNNKKPGGDLAFRINSNELKFRHWKQPKGKRKSHITTAAKSTNARVAEEAASVSSKCVVESYQR